MANYYDEAKGWIIDGQSLEEFENANKPITDEELQSLGIIEAPSKEQEETDNNLLNQIDQFVDYETRPTGAEYEKLGLLDTAIDAAKAVGTEASHLFLPKQLESQYVERTHFAENLKYMYRYGAGTLGIGKVGWALKGVQGASKLSKVSRGIGKVLNPDIVQTNNKFLKHLSAGLDNLGAGFVASWILRRPEDMEGQIADIFGETDNPIIKALQTNSTDTENEERLKGAVQDTLAGIVAAPVLSGVLEPLFKGLGKAFSKVKGKAPEEVIKEVDVLSTEMDNTLEGVGLIQRVKDAVLKAQEDNVDDIERYLIDSEWVNGNNKNKVLDIYEILNKGDEPIPLSDGSFSTQVQTWKDASKVSAKELARQTNGDGVSLMDATVKDTWIERGWLAEGEELITKADPKNNTGEAKVKVNTKATNRIVKQYADKWQLDNNIKVEWVDGKVNGADGNTLATSYLGKNKRGDIHPNITIQISKQAENPYAVLRSELEHARDIAKREVPNQKEKHFSRYEGINESEMSLGYVKKKADTRANQYTYTDEVMEVNGENYDVIRVKDKDGDTLSHIRYTIVGDDIFVNMFQNYGKQKGAGRLAVKQLMDKFPDKKLYWEAINEDSEKSYKRFIVEYPQLAKRIDYQDRTNKDREALLKEIFDFKKETPYNESTKGVTNGIENNSSEISQGSRSTLSDESTQLDVRNNRTDRTENTSELSEYGNREGQPNSSSSYTGKQVTGNTSNTNRPISERIKETNGDLNQVDGLLDETISKDVELSGTTWKDLAEDAEAFYRKVKALCGDNLLAFKKAFANNDIDLVNLMTRKVLAAERMVSDLAEEANTLIKQGKDVTDIMETIHYLSEYTSQIGSAYGRGLNEQKFARKARDFFSLTTLEKQGLNSLVDLLYTDLTSLNFTQTTKQLKEEMYNKIQKYMGGKLWENLTKEPAFGKAFDKYLTKLIADKNITPEAIEKALKSLVTDTQKEELQKLIQYATDTEALMNAMRTKQAITSIYVTNLLSSPVTQFKNIISGVTNSVYFPFKKIVAGLMDSTWGGSGKDLLQEGLKTYQYMFSHKYVLQDAWKLAKQAWKNGEGTLVSLGKDSYENNAMEAVFHFKPIDSKEPMDVLKNSFTIMCRLMGASDEFITQMNYRAITRAKAFMAAERGADALGLTGDKRAKYLQEVSDDLFEKGFDVNGKAMDVDAYAEARDIVLQTPLDGKYYDYSTGKKIQAKEQTVAMGVSQALQKAVAEVPLLKIFFPFVRTGTNILQQNLEHNLLYGVCSPSQRKLLTSNTKEGAIARSQLATGFMSFSIGLSLAMQGQITGALPSDLKTRDALLKTGWRPYSIRIGDKWVSYQGYEPLQSILGFAADSFAMTQAYDSSADTTDNLAQFAMLGTKNFINNFVDRAAFRNSISQISQIFELVESDDPKKWGKALAKQSKGLLLPWTSMGNFVGTLNDSAQTKPQGFYENLVNKYFVVKGLGDYRRNIWGERQDMYNLIISSGSEIDETPENLELQRLAELGWSPSELATKDSTFKYDYREFKGTEYKRSLHDLFLETQSNITLEGKTLREAVRELIESDDYQYMLDGIEVEDLGTSNTKINHIKAIFKRYRDAAKEEVIREYGDDFINKNGRTAAEEQQLIREAQEERLLDAEIENEIENLRSFS